MWRNIYSEVLVDWIYQQLNSMNLPIPAIRNTLLIKNILECLPYEVYLSTRRLDLHTTTAALEQPPVQK